MATGTLTGSTIAATYKSILKVKGGANNVLDADPQLIEDGDGNDSVLGISTDSVLISGSGTRLDFNTDGSGEYLSGDGTDLTIASGSDIHLTATNDINIPVNVGLRFGDGGENIETDNTDLTITSGADIILSPGINVGIGTASPGTLDATVQADSTRLWTNLEKEAEIMLVFNNSSAVADTSALGKIFFAASADGAGHTYKAMIESRVDGATAGQEGGLLNFMTKGDGEGVLPRTRMTIDESGNVTFTGDLIMANGKGINFAAMTSPADAGGMTAETLTDYEEGTWTPAIYYQNAGDQTNSTNITQDGNYTLIGDICHIVCRLVWNADDARAGDNIGIKNFPFTSDDTSSIAQIFSTTVAGTSLGADDAIVVSLSSNNTTAAFLNVGGGDREGNMGDDFGENDGMEAIVSGTYKIKR